MRLRQVANELWKALRGLNRRDCLAFAFLCVLSGAFWLMLALNDEYERDVTINLRLKNVPKGVMITQDLPQTLTVVLRDKGTTLLGYTRQVPTVTLNFEDYDQTSGHVQIKATDISKRLKQKLEATTEIIQIKPEGRLEYFYNLGGVKIKLPVKLQAKVATDSIHVVSAISCVPDSVDVYAASGVYDTLSFIPTRCLSLSELGADYTGRLELEGVRGAKCDPEEVTVSVEVDRMTEKTVSVPVEGVNFPADKRLKAFPAKVSVIFQVGTTRYKEVTASDFKLIVNYEELLQHTDGTIPLALRSVPDGVSHVRLSPSRIEFLLEDVSESEE